MGMVRACAALVCVLAVGCGSSERTPRSDAAVGQAGSQQTPAEHRVAERQDRPRIVVLGDSLTAGLGLPIDEAYPALLQRRVTEKGWNYEVVNAGVSGDTSAGGLARLDWALAGDVRILVLALGANDGLRGLPTDAMESNLAAIIERAQQRGIRVVLAGMEAPPNWGPQYIRAFHMVYPSLARKYGLPLVPFLLANVAGIERLNQRDGIHPTAEGDRIVADNVWRVLEPVVDQQAAGSKGTPES